LQIDERLLIPTTYTNQQQVLGFAVPFTSLSEKMLKENHFAEPN
jgi:hypothetical protein